MVAMTARAVSKVNKCASIERLPRAVLAINAPMDDSVKLTIASATRTSINENPEHKPRLGWIE
jgi:hypothetical protein